MSFSKKSIPLKRNKPASTRPEPPSSTSPATVSTSNSSSDCGDSNISSITNSSPPQAVFLSGQTIPPSSAAIVLQGTSSAKTTATHPIFIPALQQPIILVSSPPSVVSHRPQPRLLPIGRSPIFLAPRPVNNRQRKVNSRVLQDLEARAALTIATLASSGERPEESRTASIETKRIQQVEEDLGEDSASKRPNLVPAVNEAIATEPETESTLNTHDILEHPSPLLIPTSQTRHASHFFCSTPSIPDDRERRLNPIVTLTDKDIVLGRNNQHAGNRLFLQHLIRPYRSVYHQLSLRGGKRLLSQRIMQYARWKGCRFVEPRRLKDGTIVYFDCGSEQATKKTWQALREK